MPKRDTDVEVTGISAVLAKTPLQVPVHQRPYSWKGEQVSELLGDLEGAFSRKDEHFLGSIVVVTPKDSDRASVLDGQQRLATAALLLAGIAAQMEEAGEDKRAQAVRDQYLLKYDIPTGSERTQLKLSDTDNLYFEQLLKSKDAPEPAKGAPESHRRLFEARGTIKNWLSKAAKSSGDQVQWLADLVHFLAESAYVIRFGVADDANAFLIFETLNDRGLDLSVADLLKNFLLGRVGENVPSVLSLWSGISSALRAYGGEATFTTFLRHFWSSKHAVVREKELYKTIKKSVSSVGTATKLAKDLAEDSYRYAAMLSSDHEYWNGLSSAPDTLRDLALLGLEQYRPLLLSAIGAMQPQDVEKLLRMLRNWNVRLIVVAKLGGGSMEEEYANLAQAIRKESLSLPKIVERASSFVPPDSVFEAAFTELRASKVALARYYLRTLEIHAQPKPSQVELQPLTDPTKLTLEHVLPEHPESNWPQFSADEHQSLWNRLGNMALLTHKLNSEAKSAAFTKKKQAYRKSKLALTRELADFKQWTKHQIFERQSRLAKLAVKTWPLK